MADSVVKAAIRFKAREPFPLGSEHSNRAVSDLRHAMESFNALLESKGATFRIRIEWMDSGSQLAIALDWPE